MSNGFQFYEGTSTESASRPRITVRRGGVLVLTSAAVAMLGEDATHVQIGYNPETKAIGLRGAPEDCKGCYRLRRRRRPSGGLDRLLPERRALRHRDHRRSGRERSSHLPNRLHPTSRTHRTRRLDPFAARHDCQG